MNTIPKMQSDLTDIDSNLDAIIAHLDALLWARQRIAGLGDMPGTRLEAAREQAIPLARAGLTASAARLGGE